MRAQLNDQFHVLCYVYQLGSSCNFDRDIWLRGPLQVPTSRLRLQPNADEAILAKLGYKQEFRRAFTPLEVFGVAFSYIGLLPSIASVLFYAAPNGGPLAMVWGWAIASVFIMCIGLAMAELASAAPTSGGLYYWTYSLASPRCRNFLAWIVGYSNTIQSITAVASVDWACAIQITAAVSIASDQAYATTNEQLYGIYAALVLSHAVLVSFGTRILARLQRLYILLNVCLCLVVIIVLPIVTPSEYRNSANFALGEFTNSHQEATDSSVHMSEEAYECRHCDTMGNRINISLTFCMGTDLNGILSSPIGQPMAQILYNSLGQRGALAVWCLVILAQYVLPACSASIA
ncbi:amino acid permease-domain-containing protein [Suillus paluster]|uniref:amino acid permease-domain-containing protein n=1 Tax=Suillus paluster TaxID=48578 RepID=UPI001B87077D|nr:amino acid permease-domain-containing protein [Suillus paluster]KAG1732877.1 amino acid permease-domain-containing protein [Suillus paluster]